MSNLGTVDARRRLPLDGNDDVPLPLAGVVICCTSVPEEKRTKLAAQAEQMGAIHRYDLTGDVTHLIVGEYKTEKYRYVAKERPDVKPMTTEWIEAIRALWIEDQDIDMEELEHAHTLPILYSLRISMTGCDDPNDRAEISEQVKENGAVYAGDLTKQITHLIAFHTEGAKYKAAKAWGINIVCIDWLRDTLERGMILNEELYDPMLPLSHRGVGAWNKTKPTEAPSRKRGREDSFTGLEDGKRKLRRTASSKLNSQSEGIWGDIVSGGGMAPQVNRSGQWETVEEMKMESTASVAEPKSSISFGKPLLPVEQPSQEGMFAGCLFYNHGFPPQRSEILRNHIMSNGGHISETLVELVSTPRRDLTSQTDGFSRLFMMVPGDLPISQHPSSTESQSSVETVTFWWLERCLHNKKFMEPGDHIIGRPFSTFPIQGFSQLSISTSAFVGIDLLHVTRAIQLIGGTYSEELNPQTSVLVAKSLDQIRKDKFEAAQDMHTPIVSAKWLWDSIEAGTRLPFQPYRARQRKHSAPAPVTKRILSNIDKRPSSRASAEPTRSRSTSSISNPTNFAKPPAKAWVDDSAFTHDEPNPLNPKAKSRPNNTEPTAKHTEGLKPQETHSFKCEPLSERDLNCSSNTVSTAPAPSNHPAPRESEDYNNAIQDLLTKTKTATGQAQASNNEAPIVAKRRGPNRILGRVTSNMSATSTVLSRAGSVDSTAATANGQPAENGIDSNTALEQIDILLNGSIGNDQEDEQPPATQLEYDDPDSREAEERAMARMMGKKFELKKPGLRKAATIGDAGGGVKRTRRGKGSVGTTTGGFR